MSQKTEPKKVEETSKESMNNEQKEALEFSNFMLTSLLDYVCTELIQLQTAMETFNPQVGYVEMTEEERDKFYNETFQAKKLELQNTLGEYQDQIVMAAKEAVEKENDQEDSSEAIDET
jgi:hypothetical protein